MSGTRNLLIALLATAAFGLPAVTTAAKPGDGGGGGGGSAIRVEDLGRPAGSLTSAATAINEMGTVVVGWAYWDVTLDYPNRNYAARWTRNPTTGGWQAEDLRPLLPYHTRSEAVLVNDAGTVVINTGFADSTEHWFVMTSAQALVELGSRESVSDLNESDQMVGTRWRDPTSAVSVAQPLYWPSPADEPVELPLIQAGLGGEALGFQDVGIVGVLADASGESLVRWSRIDGAWDVERVVRLPPGYYVTGMGASGRLALMHCAGSRITKGVNLGCDWRAAAWDPPYIGEPAYLPNIAGSYSWTAGVAEDGTVAGVTVALNDVDMLPVLWPTPTTVVSLPLLSGGKGGGVGCCFNSYGQVAGHVNVVVKGRSQYHAVVWSLR